MISVSPVVGIGVGFLRHDLRDSESAGRIFSTIRALLDVLPSVILQNKTSNLCHHTSSFIVPTF